MIHLQDPVLARTFDTKQWVTIKSQFVSAQSFEKENQEERAAWKLGAASSASAADTTATAASPSSGFLALAYDNEMKPDGAAAQMIRMLGIYGITKEVSA